VVTGVLVKYFGWRTAFVVPALVSIGCGLLFARLSPPEGEPPTRRKAAVAALPQAVLMRVFAVITVIATTGALLFNFTTNGNTELLRERMEGVVSDPAALGVLLALVYATASFAQLLVGHLIDRVPIRRLLLSIVAAQVPLFLLASQAQGWAFYALIVLFMGVVFGAIPFIDAIIVRFVDDRIRSRVAGARLAVSFSISSLAVYLLGPVVKTSGFHVLLMMMAAIALVTLAAAVWLPASATR